MSCILPSVVIPPNRIRFLNRCVEQGFVPVENDASNPGYVAGVEGFHHLHCINVLRPFLWRDSCPEGMTPGLQKFNTPEVACAHAHHCIESLPHSDP